MLGVADVVWWANYGVAVVTASSVETSLIRTTHSRSGAFVDIFKEFFVKLCNRIYWIYYGELYLGRYDYPQLDDSHQGIDTSNFLVRWRTSRRTNHHVLCKDRTRRRRDKI